MARLHITQKFGYTLIELLIVFLIVAVFSGLGVASFNKFNSNRMSESETRKLVDILELAKKKSSVSDIPPTQAPNTSYCQGVFLGYQVAVTATGYDLNVNCQLTGYKLIHHYAFEGKVAAVASITVDFPALNAPVVVAPNQTIKIKNADNTSCFAIIVNTVGTIEDVKISCVDAS